MFDRELIVEKYAELLESERERVLAGWRKRVRGIQSAQRLDIPTLNDRIPALLDDIARALRQARLNASEQMGLSENSIAHGLERLWIGFDIVEVVAEYNAIRAELIEFYETRRLSLNGNALHIVNDVVDVAIGLAVKSYANEKLAELGRFRSERLSFVTHDLKTPLSAIHAAAYALEAKIDSVDQKLLLKMLQLIQRNVARMDALIKKVIEEGRGIQTSTSIQSRDVDVWPMIQELTRDMFPLAQSAGTKIINAVPDDIVVFADPALLPQIFQNLFSNAIKHTRAGEVVVTARPLDEGMVECVVNDNGEGVPQERLTRIFDKFQGDPDETSNGLGLAIVKQAVEAHGGQIAVESRVGEGSTFRFTLPADGQSAQRLQNRAKSGTASA